MAAKGLPGIKSEQVGILMIGKEGISEVEPGRTEAGFAIFGLACYEIRTNGADSEKQDGRIARGLADAISTFP
jgi:hypothetical protein